MLNCELRDDIGSGAAHRIREKGHVPGVIYGHHFSNYPLELDSGEIRRVISENGENAIMDVKIDGSVYTAMIKEVQRDIIGGQITHIDLQQVSQTEKIHAYVPIIIAGKDNLDRDNVVQQQIRKIEVECYPNDVPQSISIDVSALMLGSSLKVANVEFGEEISILNRSDEIILTVSEAQKEIKDEEVEQEGFTAEQILDDRFIENAELEEE